MFTLERGRRPAVRYNRDTVRRLVRGALCLVLLVGTGWSLAGAHPAMAAPEKPAPARPDTPFSLPPCCRNCPDNSSHHRQPASPDGGKCMTMQCCQMVPTRAETAPQLPRIESTIGLAILRPASLIALARPADIFHPPRVA